MKLKKELEHAKEKLLTAEQGATRMFGHFQSCERKDNSDFVFSLLIAASQ